VVMRGVVGTPQDRQQEQEAWQRARRESFALARRGYEALFGLVEDDAAYVKRRVAELKGEEARVGVHVRRGDCHPLEAQYRDSYIPLDYYRERAAEAAEERGWNRTSGALALTLASDDPTVYEADEFAGATRAQE